MKLGIGLSLLISFFICVAHSTANDIVSSNLSLPSCTKVSETLAPVITLEDIMTEVNFDDSQLPDFSCRGNSLIYCQVNEENPSKSSFKEIDLDKRSIEEIWGSKGNSPALPQNYILKCEKFNELDYELGQEVHCGISCH